MFYEYFLGTILMIVINLFAKRYILVNYGDDKHDDYGKIPNWFVVVSVLVAFIPIANYVLLGLELVLAIVVLDIKLNDSRKLSRWLKR